MKTTYNTWRFDVQLTPPDIRNTAMFSIDYRLREGQSHRYHFIEVRTSNHVLNTYHPNEGAFFIIVIVKQSAHQLTNLRQEYEFTSVDKVCSPGTSVLVQILGHPVFHIGSFLLELVIHAV